MEKRIAVTNNTQMNMHVGSNIVPPGETRDFPESQVPHHLRPVDAEEPEKKEEQIDLLAEMLSSKVADIIAKIPSLSDADLERLGEMEQVGKSRTTLLSAIAEALLHRAAMSDMLAKVAALSADELAAELKDIGTDVNADPDYLAALEAEQAKRAAE
ncbi:MAG: hypothetical protein LLG15_11260 [Betaproteobacteria bacterium]|nr:hypothetical protein [Betaproteobacteria bacterium]